MIFDDIRQARLLAKKSGKVLITGLDHPVLVRQADDSHIELFLDYAASMAFSRVIKVKITSPCNISRRSVLPSQTKPPQDV